MDSFEASTQLAQILRSLSPSIQNLIKAAHFALKNAESEDYLFHSIIDTIEDPKVEINTKSTIFQFIEVLIGESYSISQQPKSNYSYPYVHRLRAALPSILLKVLPGRNIFSLYNIFVSLRNISRTLKVDCDEYEHQYLSISDSLDQDDRTSIDQDIPYPEITLDDATETPDDPLITAWQLLVRKKKQSQYERLRLLKHGKVVGDTVEEDFMFSYRPSRLATQQTTPQTTLPSVTAPISSQPPSEQLLSKKQILARMEDDRETHKRSKENLWVVNRPKDGTVVTEDEFLVHYWNKIGPLSDEKEKVLLNSLDELNELVAGSYKDKQY